MILGATNKSDEIYDMNMGLVSRFGRDLSWWLVLLMAVMCAAILDVSIIVIRTALWPTDIDTFQEIERTIDFKKRLEEAASAELQQGWDRGKKKTSEEIAREEKEVQELLDRPRVMPPRVPPAAALKSPGLKPEDAAQPRTSLGVPRPSFTHRRSMVANVPATTQEVEEEDIEVVVAKRFGSIKRRSG